MRYNTPSPSENFQRLLFRGGAPVTTSLLIVNAVTFLLAFMLPVAGGFLSQWVTCNTLVALLRPWTLVTYPIAYLDTTTGGFFNFLFCGWLLWSFGGSLERSWGSQRFALFYFLTGLVASSLLLTGTLLLKTVLGINGFILPTACVVVAFCTIQPEETINYLFFPIPAKYFAALTALFTWIYFGQGGNALLGLFPLGGLLAAYLYVRQGRSTSRSYSAPRPAFRGPDLGEPRSGTAKSRPTFRTTLDGSPQKRSAFDLRGRLRDWQDRRRLEKLWKNSGLSGSEPEWRDDEKRRR